MFMFWLRNTKQYSKLWLMRWVLNNCDYQTDFNGSIIGLKSFIETKTMEGALNLNTALFSSTV